MKGVEESGREPRLQCETFRCSGDSTPSERALCTRTLYLCRMSQPAQADPRRYGNMYCGQQVARGFQQPHRGTSVGPQQVVKQLVALGNPDKAEEINLAALRFKLIEPSPPNGRAHVPVWQMRATRID
jgi:hypothetical protein